jgi:hypothetical protein
MTSEKNSSGPVEPAKHEEVILDRWNRLAVAPAGKGAPRGNQNGRKSGLYVNAFLSDDEIPLFESILERLSGDFVFNNSSDLMQVQLVGVYFLRLARAQAAGDSEAAERFDRMIRAHLKDLKTTKLSREGDQPKGLETTPADWATKVLERAQRDRKNGKTVPVAKKTAGSGGSAKASARKTKK